ncbi:8617_t:CDS:2, partial [Scutellospora calospora]
MNLDLLFTLTEFSQSDNELPDYYEASDDYETTDDEHLNNESVVSEEYISKKKWNYRMNLKTTIEKQAELANHLDILEILIGSFAVSGGASLVKTVAQELFLAKFTKNTKFSYSKLSFDQSKRLNDELLARNLHIKELWTSISNTNENNSMLFWLKLAKKGLNGVFESKTTFKGLCEIMIQIAQHEDYSKNIQNLKYSKILSILQL